MLTTADLRERARARLPRMVFDYIDGAAGDEAAADRNLAAFRALTFVPRYFRPSNAPDTATTLFGRRYGAPFGITPMGLGNMAWPGSDLALARAAAAAGIPYTLSCMGSSSVESVAAAAPGHVWFQIYHAEHADVFEDLVRRAEASGIDTLLFTVDANFPGRRLRDRRNRFAMPFRLTPAMVVNLALHPYWALATLAAGIPRFAGFAGYDKDDGRHSLAAMLGSLATAKLDYAVLERLRASWRGRLIVKGILHPEDARRIAAIGADGIVVSNHGGRQLASALASMEALPAIRAAVGPDYPLLIDSGVRSGEDVAKALAAGANFVLVGRAVLYATAALGAERGASAVIDMLRAELVSAMQQLGTATIAELTTETLRRPASQVFGPN